MKNTGKNIYTLHLGKSTYKLHSDFNSKTRKFASLLKAKTQPKLNDELQLPSQLITKNIQPFFMEKKRKKEKKKKNED